MINNSPTYISLFSSAGVGCYGFKMAGYQCIATCELIERRLNVQKANNKCKFDSGYINGDITQNSTHQKIFDEIERWNDAGNDMVDVLIATPPCQGMSIANRKRKATDYNKNSLVVTAIELVKQIKPRFFVFENVSAFMNTLCESPSGGPKPIGEVIKEELSNEYDFMAKTINFMEYGSNSSRKRTLVIGANKNTTQNINIEDLFPSKEKPHTVRDLIGNMPKLQWGEFDENDFYHQFRPYAKYMYDWIHNTPMGKSAFDNENPLYRPHKIVDGQYIIHSRKLSGKYTRQEYDKVALCIHTRNDQPASQSTIHPTEDRVFSIRELMEFMTIPKTFKWIDKDLQELNALSIKEKEKLLKQHETNIRQSIGEAVPTNIFYKIAQNISKNIQTMDD